ncbi:MAG: hypothetical protein NT075_26400 [Chloroflexi bacterium]|nr:hypothetical protein [Chloroflexota bacterium]
MQLFGHPLSGLHLMLIIVHVLAAIFALIVAPVAMITQKGGKAHRRWGKAYFWAMFVANLGALVLLAWRFNIFLFAVTILSFYNALSGYRIIYRKHPHQGNGPTWFDWSAAIVVLVTGSALLLWGILSAFGLTWINIPAGGNLFVVFVVLPIVFGIAISRDAFNDLQQFRKPATDQNWWWYDHMSRMLGSYIGLTTALMVQQVGPRLPESIAWMVWIAPTLIGTPAIIYWINRYRRQFASKRREAGQAILNEPSNLPA